MPSAPQHVRAVITRERGGGWDAQCLEFDVGAYAKDLEEVPYELERAIAGALAIAKHQMPGDDEAFGWSFQRGTVPGRYREMWRHGEPHGSAGGLQWKHGPAGVDVPKIALRIFDPGGLSIGSEEKYADA